MYISVPINWWSSVWGVLTINQSPATLGSVLKGPLIFGNSYMDSIVGPTRALMQCEIHVVSACQKY